MKSRTFASYKEAREETVKPLSSDDSFLLIHDDPLPATQHYFETEWLPELEELAKEDKFYLMKAIAVCSRLGLPLPKWIRESFLDAFSRVSLGNINKNSWDEVLGTPHPKGKHMGALREFVECTPKIYNEINSLKNKHAGLATDEYLFEQVGRKYGIGKTKASDLYYLAKDAEQLEVLIKWKFFFTTQLDINPSRDLEIFCKKISAMMDRLAEDMESRKSKQPLRRKNKKNETEITPTTNKEVSN